MERKFWRPLAGLVTVCSISALNVCAAQAYKVINRAELPIVRVEKVFPGASDGNDPNGEYWETIPGSEIEPGGTVFGTWQTEHNDEDECIRKVRAVYESGPSEPQTVNLCQEDTVIEFSR